MTPLFFALGGLVAGGGSTALLAWARIRALKARYASTCSHYTWSPWEECEVEDGWYAGRPKMVAGQKRECLACGLHEVRRVRV
jgi:hypothetical protein